MGWRPVTASDSPVITSRLGAAARKARSAEDGVPARTRARDSGLDRLRGLAVLLMLADHILLVLNEPWADLARVIGPTRAAMPLFALVAGSLVYRFSSRWWAVAAIGVLLPSLVPWVDSPNILLLLAVGAAIIVCVRRGRVSVQLALVVAAAWSANNFDNQANAYAVGSVVVLMLAGYLWRSYWSILGHRLPRWLTRCGRYPLTFYVGHLLGLQALLPVVT